MSFQVAVHHVSRSSYDFLRLEHNTHPVWALSYVQQGSLRTRCAGLEWVVQSGDIMVHPPATPYSEIAEGPGTHLWALFSFSSPPGLELLRSYPVAPVVRIQDRQAFERTFQRLNQLWQSGDPAERSLRLSLTGLELLNQVIEAWIHAGRSPRPEQMASRSDRFVRVIASMHERLAEPMDRKDLAEVAGMHPAALDRAFRQIYGAPPMEMLRSMRLERSRQLLEGTDLTLDAMALRCGYPNGAYLSRVFAKTSA